MFFRVKILPLTQNRSFDPTFKPRNRRVLHVRGPETERSGENLSEFRI